jgi:hypothetical protein
MSLYMFTMYTFSTIRSRPHVMWVDNFSKIYRVNHHTEDAGAYRDALWTGEAIHVYNGAQPIDISISRDEHNNVIPIMPDNMFDKRTHLLYACSKVDALGHMLYNNSLVKHYKVNNVPLKPVIPRASDPALFDHLAKREDGLGEFIPTQLHKMNPGSDTGLHAYMRLAYDQWNQRQGRHYMMYKADCNIFSRWCKVNTVEKTMTYARACRYHVDHATNGCMHTQQHDIVRLTKHVVTTH